MSSLAREEDKLVNVTAATSKERQFGNTSIGWNIGGIVLFSLRVRGQWIDSRWEKIFYQMFLHPANFLLGTGNLFSLFDHAHDVFAHDFVNIGFRVTTIH